jgi:arylsulfate sulfotransferase
MNCVFQRLISLLLLLAPAAFSDSLVIGFNTATPLQIYSTSNRYQGDFGPTGTSGGAIQNGLFYVAQPDTDGSHVGTITALDSHQRSINSFIVPALISDLAPGANDTLWLATYDGRVFHVTAQGQVLMSFGTGYHNVGIAVMGNSLYTTEGDTSDGIDVRTVSGNIVSTIHTGYTSLYGLGVDPSDSSFYAGTFDYVYHFSNSGSLMEVLNLPGDARTPNGAVHDGLELADLNSLRDSTAVPEPASLPLAALALFAVVVIAKRGLFTFLLRGMGVVVALALLGSSLRADVSVQLTSSTSSVSVGSAVSFSAQAMDSADSNASFTYQFSVAPSGTANFSVIKDFYPLNTLVWSPTEREGSYDVRVIANSSAGGSGSQVRTVTATSLVSGTMPVVTSTNSPLAALYSAPPCSAPQQVRVRFRAEADTPWQGTPLKACDGLSLNFYIAGMRADTHYVLQQDLYRGPFNSPGPKITFTTGTIPANVNIPNHFVIAGQQTPSSISYPFVWRSVPSTGAFALDSQQNVVWYAPNINAADVLYFTRPIPGGTFTAIMGEPTAVCPQTGRYCQDGMFLREFDLAGNLLRETNTNVIDQQVNALAAARGKQPVNLKYFNHEGSRLPNGYTASLLENEQVADQGNGAEDVLGDVVVILDRNFQVVWYWNSFEHLDIQRKGLLNETCQPEQGGCPIITNRQPNGQYYRVANDWTHCNAVTYDPKDRNLVVSSRHQAWVWKLAYRDGSGDGHIVWTLGHGGSFQLAGGFSGDAWFSYQHDAAFQSNGLLTLFDNGNYRIAQQGGNSRGQAWQLDETNLIAAPVLNLDLGVVSYALGSAQLLSNGNYSFGAGFLNGTDQIIECSPATDEVSRSQVNATSYRDYRLHNLYVEP